MDTRAPQTGAPARPCAFASPMVKMGSQLEMAHQPVVVTMDSRVVITVRRRAAGSRNNCISEKGRCALAPASSESDQP